LKKSNSDKKNKNSKQQREERKDEKTKAPLYESPQPGSPAIFPETKLPW